MANTSRSRLSLHAHTARLLAARGAAIGCIVDSFVIVADLDKRIEEAADALTAEEASALRTQCALQDERLDASADAALPPSILNLKTNDHA